MIKRTIIIALAALALASCASNGDYEANGRWTALKACEWGEKTGWRSGCDYIPATAINQIEMWQELTFDPETIDKELGWAEELGFTTMRVYLSSVVWNAEKDSFKDRIDQFLDITSSHNIKPVFVFFDDCWNPHSAIGVQPEPKPGVHNSGWVRDPSDDLRKDTLALYPELEKYVKDILGAFGKDERVLWWDLYNEPGNNDYDESSLPLVKNVFKWAHEARPSQPVSVGIWYSKCPEMNKYQLENSDIISYHNYNNLENHQKQIDSLKTYGRPIVCTEYMARTSNKNSTFQTILPMLKANNISAINWGFVSGKTNTIFAWSDPRPDGKEPEVWFHDIYRQDKTPFDEAEIAVIKEVNGK